MSYGRNIGSGCALLVLIFSVLGLTIYALLTFYSANTEKALAEKFKNSVINYYAADSKAVKISAAIQEAALTGNVPAEIDGTMISSRFDGEYTYSCNIDDMRCITVLLKFDGKKIKTISWHNSNMREWVPDESIKVWTGEAVS